METETEQKEHNVRGATLPATVVPSRVSPQPSARHVTIKTVLPGFKVTGILLSSGDWFIYPPSPLTPQRTH